MTEARGARFERGGRAFTLIELLVVISVIALLIGIVMPSLGHAKEASRRAKCLANVRSIGQGLQLYFRDSKDMFPKVRPLHATGGQPNSNDPSLLDLLPNYLDAPAPRHENPNDPNSPFIVSDPFKCPSDRPGVGGNGDQAAWETEGCSYEYFPGALILAGELLNWPNPVMGVTKAYEKDRHWPILDDWGDYHPTRKNGPTKNAVFFPDMTADWMPDIPQSEVTKFFQDAARYAGAPTP